MRISDWSSDVCSSDLKRFLWRRARLMCVSCQVEGSEGLERSGRLGAHDDVFDEGAAAIVFHDVVLIDGLVVLDLIERGFVLDLPRSEENTSELQSLMRISYAVF